MNTVSLCLLAAVTAWVCAADPAAAQPEEDWVRMIRKDHPRLFFNKDTWPAVKARALGPEKEVYERMKKRVDSYPDDPKGDSGGPPFQKEEVVAGKTYKMTSIKPAREWGPQAMETAFVYLVEGDAKYLEKAKRMLRVSVDVYHKCYEERRAVNWYSTTRVCALAAYDWIYNDLTDEERKSIIVPLLKHVEDVQPGRGKPGIYRINGSNHTTGFYGVKNIVWFAGLAAYADGHCDELALEFLRLGHKHNQALLEYRRKCAGDDGGLASATTAYSMGAYPWAQFNFLHTWRSATGQNAAPEWPHLAYFPVWIMWNWIPADNGPKEFGTGDCYHRTNDLPIWCLWGHMTQIMHFYGRSHPDCTALAAHIRSLCPGRSYGGGWSMYPFLMTELAEAPAGKLPEMKLHARHFETLGQVFMRSGWGAGDTYCLFTIGSQVPSHKQYDENNFVIYKRGFLALDSGTRGGSKDFNLRHYYAQTVAHNCVLIHMPNEPFAGYWGPRYEGPEGKTSYGGMCKTTGGKVAAFETNEHYAYVAGDTTSCYKPDKCKLALRQFVFIPPDWFVVCDRVTSTKPEYKKAWLLHTQNEPEVDDRMFRADEGGGRLFCRTLLPKDAVLEKIGGPGKEFWANGINWELNENVKRQNDRQKEKTGKAMLLGNWRMEVSPGAPRSADVFLHFIQVGDKTLQAAVEARLVEDGESVGVEFSAGQRTVRVTFGTSGEARGHVRIEDAGGPAVDRDLTRQVMQQSGVAEDARGR